MSDKKSQAKLAALKIKVAACDPSVSCGKLYGDTKTSTYYRSPSFDKLTGNLKLKKAGGSDKSEEYTTRRVPIGFFWQIDLSFGEFPAIANIAATAKSIKWMFGSEFCDYSCAAVLKQHTN